MLIYNIISGYYVFRLIDIRDEDLGVNREF